MTASQPHIRIELEKFEDMALFTLGRVVPGMPLISITCGDDKCFALLPLSERLYVVIESPPPEGWGCKQAPGEGTSVVSCSHAHRCRYYYIDDAGNLMCSQRPVVGRPNLAIVKVKSYQVVL